MMNPAARMAAPTYGFMLQASSFESLAATTLTRVSHMNTPWEVSELGRPSSRPHQTGSAATVTSQGLLAAGSSESDSPDSQSANLPEATRQLLFYMVIAQCACPLGQGKVPKCGCEELAGGAMSPLPDQLSR